MSDKNNEEIKLPAREEIPVEDTWKIEDLYENDELWEKDTELLKEKMEAFQKLQPTMTASAANLYKALREQDEMNLLLENIYVYANERNHVDMGNPRYQQLAAKAAELLVQLGDATSFVEPCLLKLSEEEIEAYLQEEPALSLYRRYIMEKFRQKAHILSEEMEAVLAKASEMGQAPQNIFQMFNNADLDFGLVHDEEGKEIQLSHGRYMQLMESKDRTVRKEAFETLYKAYESHKNMLGALMAANVTQERFFAKMRNYGSSIEAALDYSQIPLSVYDNLIGAVHDHLEPMYRYMELRRRMLGVEELHMYDIYVPVTQMSQKTYSFAEAKALVKEGLAPLGEEYLGILQEGFDSRWIDVRENKGKRSGAYSWGAYGTHPYVLLNYNGSLNHVFTLAHEMGHAIHSYHSDRTQPYPYAGYRIFVAEVASTCNEALLIHHLLKKAETKEEKAGLINYFLDQFRSTLYRQTMFAEFEKIIHSQSEPVTADGLCETYYRLNQLYFGEGVVSDEQIAMEWSRIPHFYTPFYVYQYATGFSAAIAISQKLLDGEPGIVEQYKKFLSGGSSMDCIDLLKLCGVDMTSPEPVSQALEVFEAYVKELETITIQ